MKINFNNNDNRGKELEPFFGKCWAILKKENFEIFKFSEYSTQIFLTNLGYIDIDKIKEVEFEYNEILGYYELSIVGDGFHIIRYFKKLGDN